MKSFVKKKLYSLIYKILIRVEQKYLAIKISNYCLVMGEGCKFSPNTYIVNHSKNPESIKLGNGVSIEGMLEAYERGNLEIDDYSFFGKSRIFCTVKVYIGKGCWIADNVFIMDSNIHPISPKKRFQDAVEYSQRIFPEIYDNIPNAPVTINDAVWIGANSVILKGVTIGEGSIVGAGSVVTKDVPAWTIVAGNPARIIREIPEDERWARG